MEHSGEHTPPVPTIGRIVIYRSRAAIDMPAIITKVGQPDPDGQHRFVHLQLFVPPGAAPDALDYQWGTVGHQGDDDPRPGTWRWPERAA